jgi:hypothetical protein
VSNPARGSQSNEWTAEALPDTHDDGDLEVTLTACGTGSNLFGMPVQAESSSDAISKTIVTTFRVEQNGQSATNWHPVEIETSDATGNHTRTWRHSEQLQDGEEVMSYQWGLWPDEPAWKLRVEMSRQSGFFPDEIWTVPAIPFQPGSYNNIYQFSRDTKPFAEKIMGQSHLRVLPTIQFFPDDSMRRYNNMDAAMTVRVDPPPDGMRMTVMKITDEQNRPIDFQDWSWGNGQFHYMLKNLRDAKSVNLTLAFHRSRYFEFTVKPPR